jgi:hypothetical protein
LGFRSDWNAQKEFEHESGIKSAHYEGASSNPSSSAGEEQPSESEGASGSGEAPR